MRLISWPRFLVGLALLIAATPLIAHPMGNFSVNHYTGIAISRESLQLRYILDLAEIPTFQELQASGIKADLQDSHLPDYLLRKQQDLLRGIDLQADGRPLSLNCGKTEVIFPPGAGGLPTMKLAFSCHAQLASLASGPHNIVYRDNNYAGRAGWKEVVVKPDPELRTHTNAPAKDRSAELSNYPTDLLNSPPQDVAADISVVLGPVSKIAASSRHGETNPRVHPRSAETGTALSATSGISPAPNNQSSTIVVNRQSTPRNAFTQLVTAPRLGLWLLLTGGLIAAGLGALHALEPGHGKTLVAAYLVGTRGTSWHAVALGLIVTFAHTAGVYVLGGITLFAAQYIAPEKIYPWLGAASGAAIACFGLLLFLRRLSGEDGSIQQDHRHWYDGFFPPRAISQQLPGDTRQQPPSIRQLLVLGITGGLVPCPAALVVLLSAITLHRTVFAFFLIFSFSLGLAAVLIAIGLLFVHAKRMASWIRPGALSLARRLPLLSALLITVVGIGLIAQSLASGDISLHLHSFLTPRWLLIAGLGLLLGMRHSTDSDHVIAVTTIVTRLQTLRSATLVGALWGVGHTLTILVVGSAIILLGIAIPPRVGLAMEFAVALMLILLGVLNLTGVLAWINSRLRAAQTARSETLRTEPAGGSRARFLSRYDVLRPLAVGTVHGLAGSAAVALLVLATIRNPAWAIGYLLLFGLGTIAGMMLMTAAIAVPVVWSGKKLLRLNRYMAAASGVISLAFGIFLAYQIGFVSGLFRGVAHWIPE